MKQQKSGSEENPGLDLPYMRARFSEQQLDRIFDVYLSSVAKQIPLIEQAIGLRDSTALAAHLHRLKGSSATIRAFKVSSACSALAIAAETGDWQAASLSYNELVSSYELLRQFLENNHV